MFRLKYRTRRNKTTTGKCKCVQFCVPGHDDEGERVGVLQGVGKARRQCTFYRSHSLLRSAFSCLSESHLRTSTHTHAHAHTCTYARTHTHMHTYIHTHTRIHTCMHPYTHACMHAFKSTHAHSHTRPHTHTHNTHTHSLTRFFCPSESHLHTLMPA